MKRRKAVSDDSRCPITINPRSRLASDSQTDAIRANFPAGIARPALRALVAAGYSRLEELVAISEPELGALHGMGPKAVKLIKEGLELRGLHFRQQGSAMRSTNQ